MGWFDWGSGVDWSSVEDVMPQVPVTPSYDFGSAQDFGGMNFDWSRFGSGQDMSIEMPNWTGYVPPVESGTGYYVSAPDQNYMWDTTLGRVVTPGGGEVPPGGGQGEYVMAPSGNEPDYTRYSGVPMQGTGRGEFVTADNATGQAPSIWDTLSGGLNSVNKILQTPLGRVAGAGAVGIGGLIAQQMATRNQRPYSPSPITQAGQAAWLNAMNNGAGPSVQQAIQAGAAGQAGIGQQVAGRVAREAAAEEAAAPAEAAIRAAAYPQVAALMQPGQERPLEDPIQAALRDELLSVLSGGATGVSPSTARRQQQEEQETRARLFRQEGRDYELTWAGIQTLNEMKRRHNAEQYNERLATINALNAPEQSRYQFSTTTPVNLLGARENIRRGNLQDAAGMTQFGIRGVNQNLPALSTVAPINRLMGDNPDQANQVNFQTTANRNASLAQGIGGVAGTIAGSIGQRPSALDAYFDRLYGNSSGFTSAS